MPGVIDILRRLDYYPLSTARVIGRANEMTTIKSRYKLGAGGRNPSAPNPFTSKAGVLGSDCIGFALWCVGLDRYQPENFPYYEGWINTDSMIMDAKGKQALFALAERPELGGFVVFPGIVQNGKRVRIGHVGLITGVPAEWPDKAAWARMSAKDRGKLLKQVTVVDCAAATSRRLLGRAIARTTAASSWNKPDAVFVRFKAMPGL